jgi:hypothetical protein
MVQFTNGEPGNKTFNISPLLYWGDVLLEQHLIEIRKLRQFKVNRRIP